MRQQLLKLSALLCIPALLLSGCASIVSKTNYPIDLRSEPAGATVTVVNQRGTEVFKGKTPTLVTLKSGAGYFKKAEYQVKFLSPGYAEQIIPINYRLNGWYWGNLLLGGVIGMLIIDPATGAMWKPKDPMVMAKLEKTGATASATPSLRIIDINNLPAETKAELVRVK